MVSSFTFIISPFSLQNSRRSIRNSSLQLTSLALLLQTGSERMLCTTSSPTTNSRKEALSFLPTSYNVYADKDVISHRKYSQNGTLSLTLFILSYLLKISLYENK